MPRLTRRAYVLLLLAAVGVSVSGQTSSAPGPHDSASGSGLIAGRTVDADSGQALPGAIVTLRFQPVAVPTAGQTANPGVGGATLSEFGASSAPSLEEPSILSVMTDADGWFVFDHLPAGRCTFTVVLNGYAGGGYHQGLPDGSAQELALGDHQRLTALTLKLWKFATLAGSVLDEAGEPFVGAVVRVLRRSTIGGRPVWQPVSGRIRTTDDRGMYRVSGLVPGEYIISVPSTPITVPLATSDAYVESQPPGNPDAPLLRSLGSAGGPLLTGAGLRVDDLLLQATPLDAGRSAPGPAPSPDGQILRYPTTFYPSARTSTRAAVVTMTSGEERTGLDLQLALAPTVRVSGIVLGPDGPAPRVTLNLMASETDQTTDTAPAAMAISDPRGQFTFLGVPSGQYVLTLDPTSALALSGAAGDTKPAQRGSAPPMWWASQPVVVGDTTIAGLSLRLERGLHVHGHFVFDGASRPPNVLEFQRVGVRLEPVGGRAGRGAVPPAFTNADGTFTTPENVPGRYSVIPPPWPGWTVTAITADGADVSDVPLDLAGHDIADLAVTYTDRPAELTGTVRSASGAVDPDAVVVLFPPDPRAWGWPNGVHTRSVRVTTTGVFVLSGLAPGDYCLAALSADLEDAWRDPSIVQHLVGLATRIHLSLAEQRTQDVGRVAVK
jgi:hypothetical protein